MTKHTDGPWHYSGGDVYTRHAPHVDGICKMLWVDNSEVGLNLEVEANARLIAAAPTMYDDLEYALEVAEKLLSHPEPEIIIPNIVGNLAACLRDTLRKASGEAT